ncbi:hypothetical protein [Candidatus Avelusimicrobium sp.]
MNNNNMKNKMNKVMESAKKGFADIKMVLEEGNVKLFIKQFVVIAVLILLCRYANGKLREKESNFRGQIDAVQTQQRSEADYLANKKKLIDLEPRFPDVDAKNHWLLNQIVSVFKEVNLTYKPSQQNEDNSVADYTIVNVPVTVVGSYADLGHLLAAIESRDDFMRVSEFGLMKGKNNMENIGENEITLKINTVFPKEKLAKKLFKDQGKKK